MTSQAIRVLLADDHALVRENLRDYLNQEPDITVVADVGSADEAIAAALSLKPSVLVMDIDMPGLESFEAARRIRERLPDVHIIFLTAFFHDRYIEKALAVQASGYITKAEKREHVAEAIRKVAAGGTYYSAQVQERLMIGGDSIGLDQAKTRLASLTERELEILGYLARGWSKKQIASALSRSVKTINAHCSNIMTKLEIHDRVELARFAIREGLINP